MMKEFDKQYGDFAIYYDTLMEDVDYDEWSRYIHSIVGKYGVGHKDVLEMACGTGSISVNMAKMGYEVTAFDLSEEMLSVAYNKASEMGAAINFLCQDMRDIQIDRKFGIILCVCDSINYITDSEDLQKMFKWVYSHLKEGGIFIFDINSEYKLRNIIGNNTFTYNDEDLAYIWENSITEDTVEFYLTFFVKEGRLFRRFDELHTEKVYSVKDIVSLLKNANLDDILVNEAFTFDDITQTTERINFTVLKGRV